MPTKKARMPLTLEPQDNETLQHIAKDAGFRSAAEYVRSLIAADFKKRGETFIGKVATWGEHNRKNDDD
jgi:hypothetical protein